MFSRLRALSVIVLLLGHAAFTLAGTAQAEGIILIQRASQLSDIRGSSAAPFRLRASFKQLEDGANAAEGSYTEMWFAPRQRRRDIAFEDFARTEVDDQGNRWVDGADEFPGRAAEVAGLLDVTTIYSPVMEVEAARDADVQGTKAQCVDTREGGRQSNVLCFDAGTGVLLLKKSWEEHAGHRAAYACRYQQYEKFGDRVFPQLVVCEQDGQPKLEVRILELSAGLAPDLSVLLPSPPQSTNPACPGVLKPPKAVQKPTPVYPAGEPQPSAGVTVALTVEADGKASGVRILHSAGKVFDQSALDAVKRWVFEPATCDGKPTATRVNVVVEFVGP